ncbi:MAG: hypothetical protein N2Z70_07555, partial [Bdellovibrionaceae bacterium]|nr:hypothetical protein [Pseudobdellovibrionaceae bacterium]
MISLKAYFFRWLEKRMAQEPNTLLFSLDLGYPEVEHLRAAFPRQVLFAGVTEDHSVLTAIALCEQGFDVYVYGVGRFLLWRAAEVLSLYHPYAKRLRLVGNGGGLGYGVMGPSHHNTSDYGLLHLISSRSFICYLPRSAEELTRQLDQHAPERIAYFRLINPEPYQTCLEPQLNEALSLWGPTHSPLIFVPGPLIHNVYRSSNPYQWASLGQWPLPSDKLETLRDRWQQATEVQIFEEHIPTGSIGEQLKGLGFDHHKLLKATYLPPHPTPVSYTHL